MRYKEWLQDNSGFSLIEVVLAVAILALVTLPIMNYFTYSSQQAFEGRDKQTANLVAESVLEDLNSYNNYKQIEELAVEGAWQVDTTDISCTSMYTIKQNNNRKYDVEVKVDYDEYDKDTRTITESGIGDEIDTQYNDYEIPRPSEIYSASNIVASEDDQVDQALSEFYIASKATVPKETILNQMNRTICVDVSYASAAKDLYRVKVFYLYEYNGSSCESIVEDGEIEVDKLENVFVFYNLHRDDVSDERISTSFASDIPDEKVKNLRIYFACQKSDSITPPSDYRLTQVSTDSRANLAKYFTNVAITDFELAKKEDGSPDDFVTKEKTKRIGAITAYVREEGDSEILATLSTTKAE